jgi:general secretion pathway protein B
MSFILDALRKSEHARQRQTGPGLAEVPVAAARPRTNAWAAVAVALLVVNLLAVGVYLLRRAGTSEAPASTATTAVPATAPAAETANSSRTRPPAARAPAPGPVTQGAAPARAAVNEPPAAASRNPLADEVGDAEAGYEPNLQSAAAAAPAGPAAVVKNGNARRGSVVYAPIPEAVDDSYSPSPEPLPQQAAAAPTAATASSGLPGADEIAARGTIPVLHLDLHVYATQPQQRFIFVNSHRYREGDTLTEGPVVEQITPDGAVLSFRGSRFRLSND